VVAHLNLQFLFYRVHPTQLLLVQVVLLEQLVQVEMVLTQSFLQSLQLVVAAVVVLARLTVGQAVRAVVVQRLTQHPLVAHEQPIKVLQAVQDLQIQQPHLAVAVVVVQVL
jgi:hypothetical protein